MDSASTDQAVVSGDWLISQIVTQYPQSVEVLVEYGLHCFGCSANELETLEEGCRVHQFDDEKIEMLVDDLNDAIANTPARPQELTLTKEAALAIKEVGKEEKGWKGLSVEANKDGSFFMEFRAEKELGDYEFSNGEVPDVLIFASPLTLQRIGGAVIDFREGTFKLDTASGCCGNKEKCGCA